MSLILLLYMTCLSISKSLRLSEIRKANFSALAQRTQLIKHTKAVVSLVITNATKQDASVEETMLDVVKKILVGVITIASVGRHSLIVEEAIVHAAVHVISVKHVQQ